MFARATATLVALLAAAPVALGGQGWGVREGDAAQTWRSPAVSARAPFLAPGWPSPSAGVPLVAPDGTLELGYAGLGQTAILNPDGTWRALLPVGGLEAIGPDGRLYGVTESHVDAYTPAGDLLWRVPKPGPEASDTRVLPGPDGHVYVAGDNGLNALDGAGQVLWRVDWNYGGPLGAVGPDGTVYYGMSATYSGDGQVSLVARRPDGQILWTRPLAGGVGRVAVADDGTVMVLSGGRSPELHALSPDGSERWSLPVASGVMALGADGTAYLVVGGGIRRPGELLRPAELRAVGPDGRVRWIYHGRLDGSCPVLGGDGMIYVGGSPLVALRPDGSRAWSFPATGDPLAPQAIGADGTLYVTAEGAGGAYALPSMTLALPGPAAPARVAAPPRPRGQRALLADVRLTPRSFRLRGAVSLCPGPGAACQPAHPLGAMLRYTLQRRSVVVIVVRRARDGRVMSRQVRWTLPGTAWRSLGDAADSTPLPPGRYALTMRAAAGRTRSVVGPLRFTVVAPGA